MKKTCKTCANADIWEEKGWTMCCIRGGIALDDTEVEEAAERCDSYKGVEKMKFKEYTGKTERFCTCLGAVNSAKECFPWLEDVVKDLDENESVELTIKIVREYGTYRYEDSNVTRVIENEESD